MDVARSWGRKIAAARRELGLSQVALADACGLDPSTISRIERGVTTPRDRVKWRLAGALGRTVEELFPYPAVRPPHPEHDHHIAV